MSATRITCVIPGLHFRQQSETHPAQTAIEQPKCLLRILGRSEKLIHPQDKFLDPSQLIADKFFEERSVATAYVNYIGETGRIQNTGYLMRADPVNFLVDGDRLHIVAAHALDIKEHEAIDLLQSIREHFSDVNWRIHATPTSHWYLELEQAPRIICQSIQQAQAMDLMQALPQGPDGPRWRSIINEIQMLLHQHRVNTLREEQGLFPINGYWFWGGGNMIDTKSAPWTDVFGDGIFMLGLARLGGKQLKPAQDLNLKNLADSQRIFFVDQSLYTAESRTSFTAWLQALKAIEATLIIPLQTAAKKGRIELEIHCEEVCYRLLPQHWRAWWKPAIRLSELYS